VSEVIDEHRQYLRDRARLGAYERALREVVRPGDVAVDLAAGTGILGLLACRAGASRVYAVEQDGIAGLAADIARANGVADRIVSLRGHSSMVALPEPADVFVCDQIGRFGLEADILDLVRDAKARWLRPGAAIVPARIDLIAAPVEHTRLHDRVSFWSCSHAGFDFTAALEIAVNSGYPVRLRAPDLLAAPAIVRTVDLTADTPLPLRGRLTVRPDRIGTLHGVGGWFEAALSPGVTMTNSPVAESPIDRRQVFFPVRAPIPVTPRDTIDVEFRMLPSDHLYAWDVTVTAPGRPPRRSHHSTLRGMLLSRDDVRRTDPSSRPRLTRFGRARLLVLESCDGRRTLDEIERDVHEHYPDLFASRAQAATFVAEVVTRYALADA
jgi:protein arginine N-methyltransferase 1